MRRFLVLVTISVWLMSGVAVDLPAAQAAPATSDLSTTTTGDPVQVSPVGGVVVYTVTFTHTGTRVFALLRSTNTGGGKYDAGHSAIPATCAAPADGTLDPVIVCDQKRFQGTISLDVAINTPSTPTDIISTSTAAIDPSQAGKVKDPNSTNNTSTVTTPVLNDPDSASALVPIGGSLPFRTHEAMNVDGNNGIVMSASVADGAGSTCGTSPCGDGLHLGYGTDPDRQGNVRVTLRLETDPCHGQGNPACVNIYERKPFVPGTRLLEFCLGGEYVPTCIEGRDKVREQFVYFIRMDSTDPDLLPPGTLTLN